MARNSNTLLALTLAALFAVHPCSAFHMLLPAQAPTRRIPSTTTASRIEGTWELPPVVVRTRRSALLAGPWKSDRENNDRNNDKNDNNNDAIGETAALQSSRITLQRRLHTLKCWIQFYGSRSTTSSSTTTTNNNTVGTSRRRRKQRAAAKVLAASLAASAAGVPAPALARTFADNVIDGTQTFSLRPGVTREQAEQLTSGVMPDEVKHQESGEATSTSTASEESATKAAPAKAKKSDNLYGDDEDYDDEDDFDELEFETNPRLAAAAKQRQGSFGSGSGSAPAKAIGSADDASKMTRASFSGISKDASGGKKTIVYVKASLGVAVPVFGFLGIRNYVQHRREKKQVEYSLKVMDEKRAELFGIDKDGKNITKTEGEEEDDEDEEDGSKPKGGDDDDDDDDEDDDDDDDDDEPPQRRRRSLPKPPSGPSGGLGGGSGGYDDNGGGDDGPSQDDIRKLGDLFNK